MSKRTPRTPRRRPGKFEDCAACAHLQTGRCLRCGAGEFFEERLDAPDFSDIFEFSGSYGDD